MGSRTLVSIDESPGEIQTDVISSLFLNGSGGVANLRPLACEKELLPAKIPLLYLQIRTIQTSRSISGNLPICAHFGRV